MAVSAAGSPRASELAYAKLQTMVVELELAPGELVNEAALAERIGLGRMPVREALARLSQERFLTILPRRGTVVADIVLTDVLDMLTACEIFEAGLASEICRQASDEELALLAEKFTTVDELGASGDYLAFLTADHAAHTAMVRLCRNPFVAPVAETALLHNLRFWRYVRRRQVLESRFIQPHAPLVEALTRRDSDAAELAIRTLVANARISLQVLF